MERVPFCGPEAAIEHRQVLGLQVRRAFDGAGGIDVADDLLHLLGRVAQLDERLRHGVVDDLDDAAAHQFLVLHQRQVGLDAGGVAIHHEADGAGGRDHGHLRVAVAVAAAGFVGLVPALLRALVERRGNVVAVDAAHRVAVHADHFQERLLVGRVAGERPGGFGDARAGQVRLAAHHGGDGAGEVAALVAVVGNAHRHQQRAQIGEAQPQRPEVVRVLADLLGGIAGVIDDDLLRQDHGVHGVAEGFHVELAVRPHELHQVQRRQVARRIVQEHVLRAGIRGVDARRVLAGVPAVDGGIELHAGVAALVGGFGDLAHQVARLVALHGLAGGHATWSTSRRRRRRPP